eukprot:CAMPEP_0185759250 /NCGR_PEP_ID=MMETSP1174-20130828/17974_1 /TAXON_ID=35687 /ORGANISM="Dictyocha speculum, Strain CCMP1381" /LENGTH=82 /DNA_ID=CAMNT_0028439495 /DNA_START=155 /DNA_END=403 /DNA_ORIENTATION=-
MGVVSAVDSQYPRVTAQPALGRAVIEGPGQSDGSVQYPGEVILVDRDRVTAARACDLAGGPHGHVNLACHAGSEAEVPIQAV